MQKYKVISIILTLILTIIIVYNYFNYQNIANKNIYIHDTLIVINFDTIHIEKIKPRIVYRHDTLIQTKPFTAIIDTIIQKDTIYMSYDYPENLFNMRLTHQPDSFRVQKTIEYKNEETNWTSKIIYFVAGIAAGIIINN